MRPTTPLSERLVRLTKNEMIQLREKKLGETFFHINLQHSKNFDIGYKGEKWQAMEILKNGTIDKTKVAAPKLDYKNIIAIKLLDTKLSVPIKSLRDDRSLPALSTFLLDDKRGLFESLCSKYAKVRDLTSKQIESMEAFIRKFEILEFQ